MEHSQEFLKDSPGMEERYLQLVSGRRRGLLASMARGALTAGAQLYRAGLFFNRLYYRLPWTTYRMSVPIVSIGNLTVGGTGKTPMTALVARKLLASGRRPGIASRGYMAAEDGTNEELALLAEEIADVPHLQNPNRIFAVQQLIKTRGCDVVILDDGFQHWPLARDLDIVLIDALRPYGYGHLLPRGLLREPLSSLRRAGLIVITRAHQATAQELGQLKAALRGICRPDTPLVTARHEPVALQGIDGSTAPAESLRAKSVVAVCGIGNADAFRRTVEDLGAEVVSFISFGDHHRYTNEELEGLFALAARHGANMVVTTTKDIVKWKRLPACEGAPVPVAALAVRIRIIEGEERLDAALHRLLAL